MSVKVIKFKYNKQTYKISEIHPKLLLTRFTLPILLFIFSITKRQYVKFDVKFFDPHCLTQQLTEFRINALIHQHVYISNKAKIEPYTMRDSIINGLKCNYGNKRLKADENLNSDNKTENVDNTNASENNKFTENFKKLGDKIPENEKEEDNKVKDNNYKQKKAKSKEKNYNTENSTVTNYNKENNTNYNKLSSAKIGSNKLSFD